MHPKGEGSSHALTSHAESCLRRCSRPEAGGAYLLLPILEPSPCFVKIVVFVLRGSIASRRLTGVLRRAALGFLLFCGFTQASSGDPRARLGCTPRRLRCPLASSASPHFWRVRSSRSTREGAIVMVQQGFDKPVHRLESTHVDHHLGPSATNIPNSYLSCTNPKGDLSSLESLTAVNRKMKNETTNSITLFTKPREAGIGSL
ncbi:Alkaline/neutral invertase [Psidium guajava]|nr:Alkaline/neutral invertase [Psidium guajava]